MAMYIYTAWFAAVLPSLTTTTNGRTTSNPLLAGLLSNTLQLHAELAVK